MRDLRYPSFLIGTVLTPPSSQSSSSLSLLTSITYPLSHIREGILILIDCLIVIGACPWDWDSSILIILRRAYLAFCLMIRSGCLCPELFSCDFLFSFEWFVPFFNKKKYKNLFHSLINTLRFRLRRFLINIWSLNFNNNIIIIDSSCCGAWKGASTLTSTNQKSVRGISQCSFVLVNSQHHEKTLPSTLCMHTPLLCGHLYIQFQCAMPPTHFFRGVNVQIISFQIHDKILFLYCSRIVETWKV